MIASVLAVPTATKDYTSLFSSWKVKHGKSYSTAAAEAKAFSAFAMNEEKITTHNAQSLSFTLGHNEFSDLTADEFFSTRLGFNRTLYRQDTFSKRPLHQAKPDVELPKAIDWVAKGAVTPVKNQGQCGSCWAFSTTGSLEGAYAIANGDLLSFSEEDLVQCNSVTDSGCNGGLMDNAFKWVESHGIAAESAYPYTSGTGITGICNKAKERKTVATISGYTDVSSGDEAALKSAVAQQPVSVAIEADKSVFQLYKSGILDSKQCGTQLDHGVLVVGYGTQSGQEYWKVKNSWGATWGESGYIRMAYGVNQCGISQQPSYPTGATSVKVQNA